jgi:hypothetical protein
MWDEDWDGTVFDVGWYWDGRGLILRRLRNISILSEMSVHRSNPVDSWMWIVTDRVIRIDFLDKGYYDGTEAFLFFQKWVSFETGTDIFLCCCQGAIVTVTDRRVWYTHTKDDGFFDKDRFTMHKLTFVSKMRSRRRRKTVCSTVFCWSNFLRVFTSPFLNRQVLRNRFSSPPILGPNIPEHSVRHYYFWRRGIFS